MAPPARLSVSDVLDRDDLRIHYTTIHGYRRAYVMAGEGPALLFVHGIGDSSQTWAPVLGELVKHYTVIAPDLLGHGRSDRPRADYSIAAYACGMRDLITVLGIDRVTMVGHSLGGGISMQFAYQFPERCERLVLVSTGGAGPQTHPLLQLATVPGVGALMPFLRLPGLRQLSVAGLKLLEAVDHDLGRDSADIARLFDALPDSPARQAFLRTLRAAVDRRGQVITMLDRCYLAHGMPTLLIWGARDAIIPAKQARVVHEAMPGSRLEIFPSAGHFPHHAHPRRFAAEIHGFIRDTEPAHYSRAQWRALLCAGQSMPTGSGDPPVAPTAPGKPLGA